MLHKGLKYGKKKIKQMFGPENRMKNDAIEAAHSSATSSIHRYQVKKPGKPKLDYSTRYRYDELTGITATSSAGLQGVTELAYSGSCSQAWITTGSAAGAATSSFQGGIALSQLNPQQKVPGSAFWSAVTQPCTEKFYLKSLTWTVDFTNLTSCGVGVDLFFCTPKCDMPVGPLTDWQTASDQEAFTKANLNTTIGSNAMRTGTAVSTFPGTKPTHYPEWRKRWRVLHAQHYDMGPGASEQATFIGSHNVTFDLSRALAVNNATGVAPAFVFTTGNLRNQTVVLLAVIKGAVTYDNTATTGLAPTFAQGMVGFVINKRYLIHPFLAQSQKYNVAAVASQVAVGHGSTSLKQINADDVLASEQFAT